MAKLKWNEDTKRFYHTGVEQTALFVKSNGAYGTGVPWDGFTKLTINPTGGDVTPLYANDVKYGNLISAQEIEGNLEAYQYPEEFGPCQGRKPIAKGVYASQQTKSEFGLCCKTLVGSDDKQEDCGYILHILYNALATPSQVDHETINKDPNAITLSWSFTTTPTSTGVAGTKPTALVEIDSRTADPTKLKALEDKLYGTEDAEPTLPSIAEVIEMMGAVGK